MFKFITRWREKRVRRIEVANQLREFALEGLEIAHRVQRDGGDPETVGMIIAKCEYLQLLSEEVLSGKVEPRSKAQVEKSEWPDVVGVE